MGRGRLPLLLEVQGPPELPDFETYVQEIWIEQLANNRRLYRIRGKIALDRVLRYEDLDTELAEVWDHLDLPGEPDLPRAKGNARPRRALPRALHRRLPRAGGDRLRRHHRGLRLRVARQGPARPAGGEGVAPFAIREVACTATSGSRTIGDLWWPTTVTSHLYPRPDL